MAAWRGKTEAEKKQWGESAPTSVTDEYKRVYDRYREQWLKVHGQSGSSVPRKPDLCDVQKRVSRVSRPTSATTSRRDRKAEQPGFVLHGNTGKTVGRSEGSTKKKKKGERSSEDDSRPRVSRASASEIGKQSKLPKDALTYRPRSSRTPSFKVTRKSAASSEGSSKMRSGYPRR